MSDPMSKTAAAKSVSDDAPTGVIPFGRQAKRVRAKLKTNSDLLAFMANLVRAARSGLISPDHLAKYASAIQVMKSLLDAVDTDEKIEQLEAALAQRGGQR